MPCLDDNLIAAYAAGQLTAGEQGGVIAHLDACATCLTVMCEVVRADAAAITRGGSDEPVAIARGARVDRYEILEMIGRGGMGAVYLAHDPRLDRRVALKIVRADEAAGSDRLAGEARTMARVAHPNVVAVYDSGELGDGVFIAMELVDGDTLRQWQARPERTWREQVRLYVQAGRGLAAAHAAEVVHRDFKPDNVLVDATGRAAVTDFGIALGSSSGVDDDALVGEAGAPTRTRTGALIGTPRYMAPEQLAGLVCDARSDQFSFAVALWEALYREPPFAGRTVGELRAAVQGGRRRPPPAATQVPARVAAVLGRALAAPPSARFASMAALLDALARAEAPRRGRRAIAVAAIVAAAGAFAIAHRHHDAPRVAAPPTAHTIVVIAPFANTTGEPRLDDTLAPTVAEVLARSDALDPLASLDLTYAAATIHVDPSDVDAVARALRIHDPRPVVVVRGAVARVGDGFRLTLVEPTRHVALTEDAPSLAQVLPAAARIAAGLRGALGDPPPSVPPLVSSSIDAVHETMQGTRLAMAGDLAGAAERLRHALALDPADTTARITLGLVLYNLSAQPEAIAELERAVGEAERLPERTRLLLLGDYYGAQGKSAEALSAYQHYLARWPGDQRTEINLVSIAIDAGDFALAYELSAHAVAAHPDLAVVRGNHLLTQVATGRFDDAERDGAALLRDVAKPPLFPIAAVAIAQALLGHVDAAQITWTALAALDVELADLGRADLALYQGRLADARAPLAPYTDPALAAGRPHDATHQLIMIAAIALRAGDRAGAARAATAAMDTGAVRPDYLAASLALDAGDAGPATAAAAAWDASPIPERQMFARLLAGDLARARGDSAAAITAYRDATHLGSSWLARERLGLGYLAAGVWDDAARELGWCVEHRGEAGLILTPSMFLLADAERALAAARAHAR